MTLEAPKRPLGVRIALGVVALALGGAMVFAFIPALGQINNQNAAAQGDVVLRVNGLPITQQEIQKLREGSPQVFGLASSGPLGDDLKTLATYAVVQQKVVEADVKNVNVPKAEVDKQISDIRKAQGLEDTQKYTDALRQAGLTDATLRVRVRSGLAQQKRTEELVKNVKATDAEAQFYYDQNKSAPQFQSEAKVVARQIVLDTKAKADALLARAKTGNFATLAEQNGGKNGGLVNAGKPATKLAFPDAVWTAVSALPVGGVSEVLEADKKFYIVKVDRIEPAATKPFAEAKADALKAVEDAKKNAVQEKWSQDLIQNAKFETVDKTFVFNNPTVATVDGKPIQYAEVLLRTFTNPQVGQLLQQLGPQGASLVSGFKPQVLEGLINEKIAQGIVVKEKLAAVGPGAQLVSTVGQWGTRDFKITDADLQANYKQNIAQYTTPGSADITSASFADRAAAQAFRSSFLASRGDFTARASEAGGTASENGTVASGGDPRLDATLLAPVFTTPKLTAAGEGSVTEVLEQTLSQPENKGSSKRYVVLYVRDVVKARVKPLSEVRDVVKTATEGEKRPAAIQAFFAAQAKNFKVTNTLEKALKDQEERVKKEEAAAPSSTPATPGTTPPGTTIPGTTPGGTTTAPSSGGTAPATGTGSTPPAQ